MTRPGFDCLLLQPCSYPPKLTTFNKGLSGHIPEDNKTDFINELNRRKIDFNKKRSVARMGVF